MQIISLYNKSSTSLPKSSSINTHMINRNLLHKKIINQNHLGIQNNSSLSKIKKYSKILLYNNSIQLRLNQDKNNNNNQDVENINNQEQQFNQQQNEHQYSKISKISLNHNQNYISKLQKFQNITTQKLQQYIHTKNQRKNKILSKVKKLGKINFEKFIKQASIKNNNKKHISKFFKENSSNNLYYGQKDEEFKRIHKNSNNNINNNSNNNNKDQYNNLNTSNIQPPISLSIPISLSMPFSITPSSSKLKNPITTASNLTLLQQKRPHLKTLNRIQSQPSSNQLQPNQHYQNNQFCIQKSSQFPTKKSSNPKQLKRILTEINEKIKNNRKSLLLVNNSIGKINSHKTLSLLKDSKSSIYEHEKQHEKQHQNQKIFINWKYKPFFNHITNNHINNSSIKKQLHSYQQLTHTSSNNSIILNHINKKDMNNFFKQKQHMNQIEMEFDHLKNNHSKKLQKYQDKYQDKNQEKYQRSLTEVKKSNKYIKKESILLKFKSDMINRLVKINNNFLCSLSLLYCYNVNFIYILLLILSAYINNSTINNLFIIFNHFIYLVTMLIKQLLISNIIYLLKYLYIYIKYLYNYIPHAYHHILKLKHEHNCLKKPFFYFSLQAF